MVSCKDHFYGMEICFVRKRWFYDWLQTMEIFQQTKAGLLILKFTKWQYPSRSDVKKKKEKKNRS